jgi:hypothetical protein
MVVMPKALISVILTVDDARAAFAWYKRARCNGALGPRSAVGMEIEGVSIFLGQPEKGRG